MVNDAAKFEAADKTQRDRVEHGSIQGLQRQGIEPRGTIHWNLLAPSLVEAAIRGGEGHLASGGPFAAITICRPSFL